MANQMKVIKRGSGYIIETHTGDYYHAQQGQFYSQQALTANPEYFVMNRTHIEKLEGKPIPCKEGVFEFDWPEE